MPASIRSFPSPLICVKFNPAPVSSASDSAPVNGYYIFNLSGLPPITNEFINVTKLSYGWWEDKIYYRWRITVCPKNNILSLRKSRRVQLT